MARLLQSIGHFRRHVVFIVLGQHLLGTEHTVRFQPALGDNPFTLAEQVRQDASVNYRDRVCRISHRKSHGYTVLVAGHAVILHQPANTEAAADRRLFAGDL